MQKNICNLHAITKKTKQNKPKKTPEHQYAILGWFTLLVGDRELGPWRRNAS